MSVRVYVILLLFGVALVGYLLGRPYWHPVYVKAFGARTVAEVINQYGDAARKVLKPQFTSVGLSYPPQKIALLAFKDRNQLELWASSHDQWRQVTDYTIRAASGVLGPKLREGDRQVPEGLYQIIGLNPNSSYHLSMKLNYPNSFDLKWAQLENRDQPGSDIFIHGKAVSIGCLAMGDEVIEQLFTLVADVGKHNVQVIIAPTDPRKTPLVPTVGSPAWVTELYQNITAAFTRFRLQS
ncbi:L,D-transpeptidase family protein [Marinicella litoralis]|uniref:L,D-transpeptidase family protein n=1 Tax=Marinicella litoralis TaxID=644220 RepID=UPI003FA2BC75